MRLIKIILVTILFWLTAFQAITYDKLDERINLLKLKKNPTALIIVDEQFMGDGNNAWDRYDYLQIQYFLSDRNFKIKFEYVKNWKKIKEIFSSYRDKSLDFIMLYGHGNHDVLEFGKEQLPIFEVKSLDIPRILSPDGIVILKACKTGLGRVNMVSALASCLNDSALVVGPKDNFNHFRPTTYGLRYSHFEQEVEALALSGKISLMPNAGYPSIKPISYESERVAQHHPSIQKPKYCLGDAWCSLSDSAHVIYHLACKCHNTRASDYSFISSYNDPVNQYLIENR